MSKRLSREEWNTLDKLLSEHGFGGYYDLVESLKTVLSRITKKKMDLSQVKDLPSVVAALLKYSGERS